jgi:glycosyltransferase involved in cell wall biosynthesis
MRVLTIIDTFSFGGAEHLLATLARAAPGVDLSLDVASLAPATVERSAMQPALEAAGLQPRYLGVRKLRQPGAVPRLARMISASGCDVVHAHLASSITLVPPAARLAGVPAVCTLHHVPGELSVRDRVKERLAVASASRSRALIFVSEAARRAFAVRYQPDPRTWRVVHNGLDLTAFRPGKAAPPEDLALPHGAPIVSVVAALRGPKRHDVALDAWPRVLAAVPQARLVVAGGGPQEPALRAQAARLGLGGRVLFAGPRRDVARLLQASALTVLPSQTEALPTSLIEAAACGLATVATPVGGIPEVVEHGRTGLLVPPGDPVAFGDAVIALLTDDRRREAMGRAARRLAEERFDMHRWARRLRDVYDEAVGGRTRCPAA